MFAFFALTGVVTRLAAGTKTAKCSLFYEDMALLGCTVGNLFFLYRYALPFGTWFLGLLGLGAGIYSGCLAAALAELVNMMPVLSERVGLKKGMIWIMLMFALGKLAGTLFGQLK